MPPPPSTPCRSSARYRLRRDWPPPPVWYRQPTRQSKSTSGGERRSLSIASPHPPRHRCRRCSPPPTVLFHPPTRQSPSSLGWGHWWKSSFGPGRDERAESARRRRLQKVRVSWCPLSMAISIRIALRHKLRFGYGQIGSNCPPGLLFTHHASRITHHVSRFTFHVSRFTFHASLPPPLFGHRPHRCHVFDTLLTPAFHTSLLPFRGAQNHIEHAL